jgi:ABC-type transport system substrate-binding protein
MLRGQAISGRGARAYDVMYALFHDYAPGRMRLTKYVYDNPEFYDALRAIPTAGHGAPWLAAVHRAQRVLAADAVVLPICGSRYYVAHRDTVDGYRWYPDNTLSFFDLHWA